MSKRWRNKWILALVLVMGVAGIYKIFFSGNASSSKKMATASVQAGDIIQRSTISGTVTPLRKTIITAPYQGYVQKVFVKLGQNVKAGDPIASVSPTLAAGDSVFPLRAPFSGKVVQLNKAEGEFVKASDSVDFIARLDDMSKLYVDSEVPELDRVRMMVGLEAMIKASAILDRSYKGLVRELTFAAREQDRYGRSTAVEFPMRLEVLDFDEQLRPGMSVIVDIVTQKREKVLRLRHEFIAKDQETYFVTLANGKRQPIGVGLQNEEFTEVTQGLSEGDIVQKVDFSKIEIKR